MRPPFERCGDVGGAWGGGSARPTRVPSESSALRRLGELGIGFKDLNTRQSSLEDIFVNLVSERT